MFLFLIYLKLATDSWRMQVCNVVDSVFQIILVERSSAYHSRLYFVIFILSQLLARYLIQRLFYSVEFLLVFIKV